MELHNGLTREIVSVMRNERLSTALRERRAAEAFQGSRQHQRGNVRAWLVRARAIVTQVVVPRHHARGICASVLAYPR
jgi:hypothetical protein